MLATRYDYARRNLSCSPDPVLTLDMEQKCRNTLLLLAMSHSMCRFFGLSKILVFHRDCGRSLARNMRWVFGVFYPRKGSIPKLFQHLTWRHTNHSLDLARLECVEKSSCWNCCSSTNCKSMRLKNLPAAHDVPAFHLLIPLLFSF